MPRFLLRSDAALRRSLKRRVTDWIGVHTILDTRGRGGYSLIRAFWDVWPARVYFCLNQGIDFINFCLKQGIFFLDDKQPERMFYELHYSKIFIYYCLTQGMVSG